jgi:hypothetical protein
MRTFFSRGEERLKHKCMFNSCTISGTKNKLIELKKKTDYKTESKSVFIVGKCNKKVLLL